MNNVRQSHASACPRTLLVKSDPAQPAEPTRSLLLRPRLIPVWIGIAAFLAVAYTINDPGLTWDEPITMVASEQYVDWLLSPSFSGEGIDRAWRINHEHPPLAKVWIGFVRRAAAGVAGVDDQTGSRLAVALLFGALVPLVFVAARGEADGVSTTANVAGISAAAFALLMPRLFAHAHFAALDLAMALMWLATALAFARGFTSRRWAVAAGVLFGLALLTKINAVFIPLPLLAWALIVHGRKALVPALLLAGIGAVVFVAGWPWLWPDLLGRLHDYFIGTTVDRWKVPVYYLGRIYAETYAPWHYPFVLTAFTIPLGTFACMLAGIFRTARSRMTARMPLLALINFAAILAVTALPGVPKYDGVRLFLAAFPFAAWLAGYGFAWGWQRLADWRWRPIAAAVFILLQGVGILTLHPYETSYYSGLCGALPGAHRLGMETTYWGDVYAGPVLGFVQGLPPETTVAFHPLSSFVRPVYQNAGFPIVEFSSGGFDYAVIMAREGMLLQNERAADMFAHGRRVLEIKRLGIALCVIVDNTQGSLQ